MTGIHTIHHKVLCINCRRFPLAPIGANPEVPQCRRQRATAGGKPWADTSRGFPFLQKSAPTEAHATPNALSGFCLTAIFPALLVRCL
jgi:hypothetical protein